MNENHLEQIREDLKFLLSFVPAKDPKQVEEGLAPMFYITGTFEGDKELARRIKSIINRYGIVEDDTEEDYENIQ